MSDELLILPCDRCGARLKVKPSLFRLAREAKCGKCGNRIPFSRAVPASSLSPSVTLMESAPDTLAPASGAVSSLPPELLVEEVPVPAAETPPPMPPVMPPVFTPKTVTPPPPARTPLPQPAPAASESAPLESPSLLKKRVRELEEDLAVFRSQVIQLEGQAARQAGEAARFQELLQRTADAEDRSAELQQLWYQKEKEGREAEEKLRAMTKERDNMAAERDVVLNNAKDLLSTYHAAEIEAARKRLAELDDRMDRFVSLMKSRNAPPAG